MARSINWKATVALSVLFCCSVISFAQSPKKITYTCRAEKLESVIDHLSKTTGYDFIYSRDLVDVSRPISLTVKDKSINEVLSLIEKQVNVFFKLQDRHIIVKATARPIVTSKAIAAAPALKSNDSLLLTSISRTMPVVTQTESQAAILQKHLDKRIREVQKMLGPGFGKNIPSYYVNQINVNNRHRSWFVSAGTSFSDFNTSFEIQAGVRGLYAVFQPHYSFNDGFYGSYGVGNSFNLTGNFAFNTIYMFSNRNTSDVSYPYQGPFGTSGPAICKTQDIHLHQLKMMLQYSFSKNLSVRVGPVLNYRNTLTEITILPSTMLQEAYSVYGSYSATTSVRRPAVFAYRVTRTFESWIGWDASIQYRINFFEHK